VSKEGKVEFVKKYEFLIGDQPVILTEEQLTSLWIEIGVALGRIKGKKKIEKKQKEQSSDRKSLLSELPLIGWIFDR